MGRGEPFGHASLPARTGGSPSIDDVGRQAERNQFPGVLRARPPALVDPGASQHRRGEFRQLLILHGRDLVGIDPAQIRLQGAARQVSARVFARLAGSKVILKDSIVSTTTCRPQGAGRTLRVRERVRDRFRDRFRKKKSPPRCRQEPVALTEPEREGGVLRLLQASSTRRHAHRKTTVGPRDSDIGSSVHRPQERTTQGAFKIISAPAHHGKRRKSPPHPDPPPPPRGLRERPGPDPGAAG